MKLETAVIRVKRKELKKAAIDHNLKTNRDIAMKIGVSETQLWRALLPVDHPQYTTPSKAFIAGVLLAFEEPFDKFFFLDKSDASTHQKI